MLKSIALRTDSYKFSHYRQYPPNTTEISSYFESRSKDKDICFFGLQSIVKKHLRGRVVDQDQVDYAQKRVDAHLGKGSFNKAGWDRIVQFHGGRLPVKIRAVPEGLTVPSGNVLMTVENTDSQLPWLTNYLETLLMQVWYPTSVATLSRTFKQMLNKWGQKTGADPGWLPFALHDFGFRGVSSVESAGIGGAAHLVNFLGSDTFEAVEDAYDYYNEELAAFSVPAAEHSTITSWGQDHEVDAYRNMLRQFPTGIVAVVSDSYDITTACHLWGTTLKDEVMKRDGRLVVRPDSGVPHEVVLEVVEILWSYYGGTTRNVNGNQYRILDPHIRVIQGDGVDIVSAEKVLQVLEKNGFAADNVVFGMGGALLQKLNRDTYDFAFKCSSIVVDGNRRDVFKNPKHMSSKASKRGLLKLVKSDSQKHETVGPDDPREDILQDVFLDGNLLIEQNFSEIRERAAL